MEIKAKYSPGQLPAGFRRLGTDATDTLKVTVANVGLVAYRPQTPHFTPIPVPSAQEEVPGVGIRRNTDDDDGDGIYDNSVIDTGITGEDDLIRIDLHIPTITGIEYRPFASDQDRNKIRMWLSPSKTGPPQTPTSPVPLDGTAALSAPAGSDTAAVWIEWISASASDTSAVLELQLRNAGTADIVARDTNKFYPFTSVVIVFGGNNQNPADTDGDGSIGDPIPDPDNPGNREGMFDVAQQLYESGWDVHAFDEEEVDAAEDQPYQEVVNALTRRHVTDVAIFGYSQGGGATHDLAERFNTGGYNVEFAAFIDAVDHDGSNEENDYPNGVDYLLNIYQENGLFELGGGPIQAGSGQQAGDALEEINVTTAQGWANSLNHYLIDDDPHVQNKLKSELDARLDP